MLRLTQEMRQFESIFLISTDRLSTYHARIFTMEEAIRIYWTSSARGCKCFALFTRNQTDADLSLILPGHLLLAIVGIIGELNLASQGVS